MTTKFKSFDASPLVAFVQSPLGARNRPRRGPPIIVVVVWLDESTAYNLPAFPDQWNFDSRQWDELTNTVDRSKFVAAVFDAPVEPGSPLEDTIIPQGGAFPRVVTKVDVARTPSAETILGYFRALIAPRRPVAVTDIWFFIDGSGSMQLFDIQPAFGEFLDLLDDEFAGQPEPPNVRFSEFFDERWLSILWGTVSVVVPTSG